MPAETILAIVAVALVVNVALMAVLLAPGIRARFGRGGGETSTALQRVPIDRADVALAEGILPEAAESASPPYDRVFRIVSWTFLMATALIVAASGLWSDRLPRIVVWIAIAGGFTLVIHDLTPGRLPATLRGFLQAVAAIAFAAVLMILTDGFASPFGFAFPLIVGGASLVIGLVPTLGLAVAGTAGYLAGGYAGSGAPRSDQVVTIAVTLVVMYLLAGIGSIVGREQRRSRDAALRLSSVDALTGLFNRTFFFAALEREIARSERSGRGFCLIMLDLDELKAVNDRHGHHAGDAVLRAVAETVQSGIRKIDVAARYGGDEFVALLPETDPTGGWVLAEKIRLGVADAAIAGIEMRPTVSVGVVSYPTDGRTADALMLSADRAMYVSKRGGKNRVARASVEPTMVSIEPELGRGSSGRAV